MEHARQELRYAENHLATAHAHLARALHRATAITLDPLWLDRFRQALAENIKARTRLNALGTEFGLATEPPI